MGNGIMNKPTNNLRQLFNHTVDKIEMQSFNNGFEAAANALDELSNIKHRFDEHIFAEHLRWAAKELRGENND